MNGCRLVQQDGRMLTCSRTSHSDVKVELYVNGHVHSYFKKSEKHTPNANIAKTDLSSRGLDGVWQTRHPSQVAVSLFSSKRV